MKTEKAKNLLEKLIEEYTDLSLNGQPGRLMFNKHIGDDSGYVYIRHMVVTNYICLASLDFSEDVQNQGVLTDFINHIKSNPFNYPGISVENSQNPILTQSLLKQGFELVPVNPLTDSISPTLLLKL